MKKILIIVGLILMFANPVLAFDEWTKEDTAYQLTLTSLLLIDWAQTREIVKDPSRRETNPFLGSNPSMEQVNTLIPLSILGHYIISTILPQEYRRTWQNIWIGVELHSVSYNYQAGIRFEF